MSCLWQCSVFTWCVTSNKPVVTMGIFNSLLTCNCHKPLPTALVNTLIIITLICQYSDKLLSLKSSINWISIRMRVILFPNIIENINIIMTGFWTISKLKYIQAYRWIKTLWMKISDSKIAAGFTEIFRAELLAENTPWDEDISPLAPRQLNNLWGWIGMTQLGCGEGGRLQF